MVLAIVGILLLLAFLPTIISSLNLIKSQTKTEDQIKTEQLAQEAREEKGALGNTVDFLFGEGTTEEIGEIFDTNVFTGETPNEERVRLLEKEATEKLGSQVIFPEDTIVTKEGVVTSSTSPTFKLSEQDIININESRVEQGLEPLGIQSDIISEVIEVEATNTLFSGKRTRFGV